MIRVFTSNYTPDDYAKLADILRIGMVAFCKRQSTKSLAPHTCDSCEYQKVCIDVISAKDFCEKKSKPFD